MHKNKHIPAMAGKRPWAPLPSLLTGFLRAKPSQVRAGRQVGGLAGPRHKLGVNLGVLGLFFSFVPGSGSCLCLRDKGKGGSREGGDLSAEDRDGITTRNSDPVVSP